MKTPVGSVVLLAALMWLTIGCFGMTLPDWFGEEEQATAIPAATRASAAAATPVITAPNPLIPTATLVPTATNLPAPSATPGSSNNGRSIPGQAAPPLPTQVVPNVTVAIPDHVVAVVVHAQVVTVDVIVAESDPPEYFAQVASGLANACVEFHGYELNYEGDSVIISIYSLEPGPASQVTCAAIYREHETSVPLGSHFQSGQEYTVTANGKATTFIAQ